MADIDLLIHASHRELAAQVLLELGFHHVNDLPVEEDASNYSNRYGVLLDVHHRFRLFEERNYETLVIDFKPRLIDLETLRTWNPSAMLAHLVTHLDGHRRGSGYRLSWLMDLAYVVQKWGSELDWAKIQRLLPDERLARETLRLLLFLDNELDVAVPRSLAQHAGTVRPLSLSSILRSARLAQWGLPGALGWGRLLMHRLDSNRHDRQYPRPSDLICWPGDYMLEKVIPGRPRK